MKNEPTPNDYSGHLITGGPTDHILPWLCNAIHRAVRIDMAVAFIQRAGLELLREDLQSALARENVQVRILTSDYLGITDPQALRELMLLQQSGAEVKVYECALGSSFHLKTYLFVHQLGQVGGNAGLTDGLLGEAFVGSSNISRQALKDGLEWNYRICYPGDDGFLSTQHQFNQLFAHPRAVPLTHRWIDEYEQRRRPPASPVAAGSHENAQPPTPTLVQLEALAALDESRMDGYRRGLVVLATGLGKTWLAAFDVKASKAKRVLFVAHREEILHQAAATFVRIGDGLRVGFYKGQQRDVDVDVLCASIQTIGRSAHLSQFATTHFDYIVVDEFHHAAAPTYHRLLNHFTPRFLLGLTATPDRTDQSDILSLCDDNVVFECNLFRGIEEQLLAPFQYHGIFDESVDYTEIPWRSGKFDPHLLSVKLATLSRARHALRVWREEGQRRTLAFCVSKTHAEFMAEQFNKAGVRAAAVYSGSAMSRGKALEDLESNCVFQTKVATDSRRSLPPIPRESCH